MLVFAIVFITLALVFYTLGVWSEKRAGSLRLGHLVLFWLGFGCDTTGTALMEGLAGGWSLSFHAVSGALAIILMLFHAAWGSLVLAKGDEKKAAVFHRLSLGVWALWLLPYLSGLVIGMTAN